jgi:hypothetical protein
MPDDIQKLRALISRDLKNTRFPANGRDLDELVYEAKMDEIVQDQCVDGYFPPEEPTAVDVGRAALRTGSKAKLPLRPPEPPA